MEDAASCAFQCQTLRFLAVHVTLVCWEPIDSRAQVTVPEFSNTRSLLTLPSYEFISLFSVDLSKQASRMQYIYADLYAAHVRGRVSMMHWGSNIRGASSWG